MFAVQSNYEPLNRNNDCIGQWSWYYRGCWHQTCPPLEIQYKHSEILQSPWKGSELLKLTAFQLSTQSVGELPSLPKQTAMPDTRHFYTQPLQLVTASVNDIYNNILFTYNELVNKDN